MEIISRKDAKELGLHVYFTGNACKRGAISNRSVASGQCLCEQCVEYIKQRKAIGHKKWRAKHKHSEDFKRREKESSRNRYLRNREVVLRRARQWALDNPEKYRASALAHYHRNRDSLLAPKRERAKKFRDENPAKVRAYIIERRKGRKLATPAWADMAAINAIYREARSLQKSDGIERHVDHIIPLINDLVCGLHVHQNLQILTAAQNIAKRNTFEIIE